MKRLAAVVMFFGCAGLAQAQLRTIPPDAQRGVIRHDPKDRTPPQPPHTPPHRYDARRPAGVAQLVRAAES